MRNHPTQTPLKGRLVVGLHSAEPELIGQLAARLALEFGELALQSERWEAGGSQTQWLALAELDPGQLAAIKQHALRVERLYLDAQGRRRIGLEVGFVDPWRFARAMADDAPHRICLAPGVWGEVPLVWDEAQEGFVPLAGFAAQGSDAGEPATFLMAFLRLVHMHCLGQARGADRHHNEGS